jgi:hypothetical protein
MHAPKTFTRAACENLLGHGGDMLPTVPTPCKSFLCGESLSGSDERRLLGTGELYYNVHVLI